MRYTLLFSILILLFTSCKKQNYSSTPSIKFESVSTTQLQRNQTIKFTFSFTDAEGDILDSVYVQELVPNCQASNVEGLFPIPTFPSSKNQKHMKCISRMASTNSRCRMKFENTNA